MVDFTTMAASLEEEENWCRNPDGDIRGPWCFTDVESGQMGYCNVPICSKYIIPMV